MVKPSKIGVARRQAGGLTLFEVICALGILALTVLTVLSLCTSVLRYHRQSSNALNAARVNDMVLERTITVLALDSPPGTRDDFWAASFPYPSTPYKTGSETVGGQKFSYAIYAVDVPGLGDATSDPPNLMRRVDSYVWWDVEGKAGRKRTVATRLINSGEEP